MKLGTVLGFMSGCVATYFIASKIQPTSKQKTKDLKEKIIKILD